MNELGSIDKAKGRARTYVFATALGLSVGLNVVLAVRVYQPRLWRNFRLAMIRPPTARQDDRTLGPANAPTTVIEYSDFQCPFSARIHPALMKLALQGKIKWIYRNYPLSSIHPHAAEAAEAAECAGEQGKFWDYADALFTSQASFKASSTTGEFLGDLASRLGLDEPRFQACRSARRYEPRVKLQVAEANAELVDATPTLFINGKRQVGALSQEQLEQALPSLSR